MKKLVEEYIDQSDRVVTAKKRLGDCLDSLRSAILNQFTSSLSSDDLSIRIARRKGVAKHIVVELYYGYRFTPSSLTKLGELLEIEIVTDKKIKITIQPTAVEVEQVGRSALIK